MKHITIYTDGACKGNPGPGGWGALLEFGGRQKSLQGGELQTTNNRMEMMAAIIALEGLKEPCKITLNTDSKYLMTGLNEWLPAWKARGWRTASRQPVKNQDLWQRLDAAVQRHDIEWQWVKGHAGNPGNEAADSLANEAVAAVLAQAQVRA